MSERSNHPNNHPGSGRGERGERTAERMKDYQRRRLESVAYIQQMLGELRTMAEIERCDMLTYLIEMAYVEAGDIRRGVRPMRVRQRPAAMPTVPPVEFKEAS